MGTKIPQQKLISKIKGHRAGNKDKSSQRRLVSKKFIKDVCFQHFCILKRHTSLLSHLATSVIL